MKAKAECMFKIFAGSSGLQKPSFEKCLNDSTDLDQHSVNRWFKMNNTIRKNMSRVCQITGKRPRVGNNVSHANNKTKRRFLPNLHKKRFYVPEEDKWITLKVSTTALRTINKKGISAVLKEAKAKGLKLG